MEWIASTLHTTSEHGVYSITTADAHTSAANSRLNWRPHQFKWTRPFCRKTKSGFCVCAITFQTQSTKVLCVTVVRVCIILWPSVWGWVRRCAYNFIPCQDLFLCENGICVVFKCMLSDTGKVGHGDFCVTCCRTGVRSLGVFAKLPKATISFITCLSVRLSVRMEQLGSHFNDFHEIWYLSIFRKSVVEKIKV
jgi:hypothetical protein